MLAIDAANSPLAEAATKGEPLAFKRQVGTR
jgi:hypothetical protein